MIIFPFYVSNTETYAATDAKAVLDNWLIGMGTDTNFYHFTYVDEGNVYNAYFMQIPLPAKKDTFPRIIYRYSASGSISFIYQDDSDGDGEVEESAVRFSLYSKYEVEEIDKHGNTILDENGNPVMKQKVSGSVLKRQAANNFNAGDSEYGYLIELASNVGEYEGKPLYLRVTVQTAGNETVEWEKLVLEANWKQSDSFTAINQQSASDNIFTIIWRFLTDALNEVKDLLESLINKLFIALADGIYSLICSAVGEPVTLDSIIFGRVGKLSINFWDGTAVGSMPESANNVMSVMKSVVDDWYKILFAIAVLVYLAALLVIGVKILYTSTGEGKAKYKDVFMSWLSGVMILFLFPYVMKYTVTLNNLLIVMMNTDLENVAEKEITPSPNVDQNKLDNASDAFGEDDFVESISDNGQALNTTAESAKQDMMLYIRELACNLGEISLTLVYYVMLGQLIVILFVYYKRVFMVAFLITIFPIVAIMYIVEKLTSGNSKSFATWLKEYIILIFTQSFHAAVYVVVVNAGVEAYINTDNWLFLLLCVIFLFEGERILRSIFGMKSSANTIGDLARTGMAGYGAVKTIQKVIGGKKKNENKSKSSEDKSSSSEDKSSSESSEDGVEDAADEAEDESEEAEEETEEAEKAADDDEENANKNNSDGDGENEGQDGEGNNQSQDQQQNQSDQEQGQENQQQGQGNQQQQANEGQGKSNKPSAADKIGERLGVGDSNGNTPKLDKDKLKEDANKQAEKEGLKERIKKKIEGVSPAYKNFRMKRKVMNGELDEEFKKAGINLESLDSKKQKLVRKVLAQYEAEKGHEETIRLLGSSGSSKKSKK